MKNKFKTALVPKSCIRNVKVVGRTDRRRKIKQECLDPERLPPLKLFVSAIQTIFAGGMFKEMLSLNQQTLLVHLKMFPSVYQTLIRVFLWRDSSTGTPR